MSKKTNLNPITAAIGTVFVITMANSPVVNAAENPFAMNDIGSGYMVADKDRSCGETFCGEKARTGKNPEGKCGEEKAAKETEGKCGEGKCGGAEKDKDRSCGETVCGAKTRGQPH
jgi:uncharacterized low-complexity protein